MSLKYDPAHAVATISAADRRLARLIERAGPFTLRPERMHSPFHALMRAIVYQQLSGKAAATILGRVLELFPGGVEPAALLACPPATLRAAGMSHAKIAAVRDLAEKSLDGTVPTLPRLRRLDDAEVLERLSQVRGVGRWTVEMLLIFRLGRGDVLPVGDLGVRRGFMLTYGGDEMPTPDAMTRRAERWRPYRSVASWYLWRAVDLHKADTAGRNPLLEATVPARRKRKGD